MEINAKQKLKLFPTPILENSSFISLKILNEKIEQKESIYQKNK